LDRQILRIEQLHSESLASTSEIGGSQGELNSLVASTSSLINSVKANLDRLANDARTSRDQGKLNLVNSQRKRFQERVGRYQNTEKAYRDKLKERAIRQYQIGIYTPFYWFRVLMVNVPVNPDASETEISAALDDPNTQIFQQALLSSSRSTQARTTLHEVQSRHNDIVAIERKVTELAQLFNELAIVIEAQEEQIEPIVQRADETQLHMKDAEAQVSRAVKLAQAVRRKKWWCLFIILLIIVIIVVVVVLTQVLKNKT